MADFDFALRGDSARVALAAPDIGWRPPPTSGGTRTVYRMRGYHSGAEVTWDSPGAPDPTGSLAPSSVTNVVVIGKR